MNGKRITIYHIAKELGISGSYVSRALNDHPSVNPKIVEQVKKKAAELNYKHNSHAANLRRGTSKTIGVIVPHINQRFFSDAIAGIEEACFENNYNLIICQSQESYEHESKAIETLIHQNVDCIIISISFETKSPKYLEEISNHEIALIQFDRTLNSIDSYRVINDNKNASYRAVKSLSKEGYKRIAFLGGPNHLTIFKERREGYLEAIKEAGLEIPSRFIIDDVLSKDKAAKAAKDLLALKKPPDAFFSVSDLQSLGVVLAANSLGIKMPQDLGVFGFANEAFAELLIPSLSSVDQKSKEMGKCAANLYFKKILSGEYMSDKEKQIIIASDIIARQSSSRSQLVLS